MSPTPADAHTLHHPFISVLLATLGTEAQVVTAAWSLLRARGASIAQVEIFLTQAPSIQQEAHRLAQAVQRKPLFPPLRFVPLGEPDHPIHDVITADDTRAAFVTIYRRLRAHKAQGHRVHFLIAGGRKPLALFGMAAAQLLFDAQDRLWHLYSAGDFLTSRRLFPTPTDRVQLVPLPVVPWHRLAPGAVALAGVEDPWDAVRWTWQTALAERMERARAFVEQHLTAAERRVVALLVREGLSDRDLATRLHMSERTVGRHLSSAYTKAAAFWGLDRIQRAQLVALLHLYFLAQETPIGEFSP